MARDYRKRPRQTDPLVAVAAEAAGVASELADTVVESIATIGGRRTRSAAEPPAPRRRAARTRSAAAAAATPRSYSGGAYAPAQDTTADLLVELLGRFGDAVREFAATFAERGWDVGEPEYPTLEPSGPAGGPAPAVFDFTNTGPTALNEVTFEATDLLGAAATIDASKVSFKYGEAPHIPRIGPGGRASVRVVVDIDPDTPAGIYRGVIAARSAPPKGRAASEAGPEGAWTLLELKVEGIDPRRPITPAERSRVT